MAKQEIQKDIDEDMSAEEALLEIHDEEFETVRLTLRQKLTVGATILISFIIFSAVVFLPLDLVVRAVLAKYSRMMRIDFMSLDLNLFEPDKISGLKIFLPDGSSIQAEEIQSQLGYREMMIGHPHGTLNVQNFDVSMSSFACVFRSISTAVDLQDVMESLDRWKGELQVRTGPIDITSLPVEGLPIPINAADVKISSLIINAKFNEGRITLNGTSIKSNVFDITVSGTGRLSAGLTATRLETVVCLTPKPDLENINNVLFGLYLAGGGTAGGRLCLNVTGTPGSPQFKKASE